MLRAADRGSASSGEVRSLVVTRLANVRSELQASGLNPVVDTTSTILLPPELTCGIWLEFREGR
jgi:hypothetical protein